MAWKEWTPDLANILLNRVVDRMYALVPSAPVCQKLKPTVNCQIGWGGSWAISVGPLTWTRSDILEAFVGAWLTHADPSIPTTGPIFDGLVDKIFEEIFGPWIPGGEWGITKYQGHYRLNVKQPPIWFEYDQEQVSAPKVLKGCQGHEDHFFATRLGDGKCFFCGKTTEEAYGKT